jgi:hypothetical protein
MQSEAQIEKRIDDTSFRSWKRKAEKWVAAKWVAQNKSLKMRHSKCVTQNVAQSALLKLLLKALLKAKLAKSVKQS